MQRHILRNCIFVYAIENKKDLIIGEKSSEIISDVFDDKEGGITGFSENDDEQISYFFTDFRIFYEKAGEAYRKYEEKNSKSLRWISSRYFDKTLKEYFDNRESCLNEIEKSEFSELSPERIKACWIFDSTNEIPCLYEVNKPELSGLSPEEISECGNEYKENQLSCLRESIGKS